MLVMGLIIKSFILSFGVAGRMILPAIAISIAAGVVWSLLNLISGGYADYVSGPITTTFVSLFGIRMALSLLGDSRPTQYEFLALYAVLYGLFLLVAKGAALMLADVAAVLYSDWKLGDAISLRSFADAERSLQFAFAFHALSAKAVSSLVLYSAVSVAMAVPLASAARAAGRGAANRGFFNGFGQAFLPLFLVFSVSFFLQFFFNLFALFFGLVPIVLSLVSIVFFQTMPEVDADVVLKGLAASAGLLWLHAWIWSASAVALTQWETAGAKPQDELPEQEKTAVDMRALRKSRG